MRTSTVAVVATYVANGDVLELMRSLQRWVREGSERSVHGHHDGSQPGWTVIARYPASREETAAEARRRALEEFADECVRSGLQGATAIMAYLEEDSEGGGLHVVPPPEAALAG